MKFFKSFLGVYFALSLFCIALIVLYYQLRIKMNFESQLAQIPIDVLTTLLAASLAGAFTLLGVEKTFDEQNKKDFVKDFPLKIYHLDNILKELLDLKNVTKDINVPLLVTKKSFLESLLTDATAVDGYIYFEIRKAHISFSSKIDQMYYSSEKLCSIDNYGQWEIDSGHGEAYQQSLNEANKIIVNLENVIKEYREDFIKHYDKNLNKAIYKKING
ncbi:hypothetical protein [Bacillus infantis]|uniref:hypothetical protein n=1 Tax=Bacillus infantis TaxID=324767 RepID=UPI003CEB02D1